MNIVTGMILDYRAFDTFGESCVLFIASCCVLVLLRLDADSKNESIRKMIAESDDRHFEPKDDIILQKCACVLVPVIMIFGIYIILNGHLSPGGGFSGGATIGAGLILYVTTFGFHKTQRFFDEKTYLDEDPVCRYWSPDFLFKSVDEDMAFFRKRASQKIIRLKEYETDDILKKYVLNYYYQAFILIRKVTSEAIERLSLEFECMSDSIQVLFGKYMDKPLVIYQKGT